MTDDLLMDSLSKLRSNANAARGAKRPERKQELLISIGLAPETTDPRLSSAALSGDGAEQEMGDEGEFMEGDGGIPGGVDTRPSDLVQSSMEHEPDEDDLLRRRGY